MPKLTIQVRMILAEFLKDPDGEMYGFELAARTTLRTGTVYPILARLQEAGWLTSEWESERKVSRPSRPSRRYYHLTSEGRAAACAAAITVTL